MTSWPGWLATLPYYTPPSTLLPTSVPGTDTAAGFFRVDDIRIFQSGLAARPYVLHISGPLFPAAGGWYGQPTTMVISRAWLVCTVAVGMDGLSSPYFRL